MIVRNASIFSMFCVNNLFPDFQVYKLAKVLISTLLFHNPNCFIDLKTQRRLLIGQPFVVADGGSVMPCSARAKVAEEQ